MFTAHPTLNGKSLTDQDKNGKPLSRDPQRRRGGQGQGWAMWPRPGSDRSGIKVSYVTKIESDLRCRLFK
jgi:hypothetical protein